jgi:GNAT superfamily N-acetyltransferase
MGNAQIREAKPGDELGIHEAHMRSIREICVKDHGTEEIRGWGYRNLDDRWTTPIKQGGVWVVELDGIICGMSYIRLFEQNGESRAHLHALYLTPEIIGQGFGLRLVELMLSKAQGAGAKLVTLESSITAHEFYKRLGFADNGPMRKVEIGGFPVTSFPMILRLS